MVSQKGECRARICCFRRRFRWRVVKRGTAGHRTSMYSGTPQSCHALSMSLPLNCHSHGNVFLTSMPSHMASPEPDVLTTHGHLLSLSRCQSYVLCLLRTPTSCFFDGPVHESTPTTSPMSRQCLPLVSSLDIHMLTTSTTSRACASF